jgi:hypothetical protein
MNFTLADLLFSSYAFLLFALFLIPPGYSLAWALDLLSFRKQDPAIRFLLSLPLSIALAPVLVYLLGRFSFAWPVSTLFAALFLAFAIVAKFRGLRVSRIFWIFSAAWLALSFLSLADLQLGKQLYYSVVAYDYTLRTAVTAAFVRAHSLPVTNPLFNNGTPQPFRYHYFWFMLCALPVRLSRAVFGYTGLTARHAVIASSAWAGLALFSTVALYLRLFLEVTPAARRRLTLIALLFIGISGLDIIPVLAQSSDGLLATVDWWNDDQITGWLDTMLWVPHALGGLVACLMGFLIFWKQPKFRWQDALGAALAFASATGLSIYVTLVFAVCLATWMVRAALRRDWLTLKSFTAAGLGSALLTLPFLIELAGKPGAQHSFLTLEVRHFAPLIDLLQTRMIFKPWVRALIDLLSLPIAYFLELGFFFVAGWTLFRKQSTEAGAACQVLLAASLVFCSFVRSDTIRMNDLGARGMLIAQFVLLLWAAQWLAEKPLRQQNWLVKATLAIGLLTSVFELGILRVFPILADKGIIPGMTAIDPDEDLGQRDFDARQVYTQLDRLLPPNAIEQHNPSGAQDIMAGLYSDRPAALADLGAAVTFTGDLIDPPRLLAPLKELFDGSRNDAIPLCHQLGISALIVKDVDPVWKLPESWAWTAPVLAASPRVRAIDCRAH